MPHRPSRVVIFVFNLSSKTYGVYLAHIMVLNAVHHWLEPHLESAALKLPLIALITYIITFCVITLISYLPGSKWLVG